MFSLLIHTHSYPKDSVCYRKDFLTKLTLQHDFSLMRIYLKMIYLGIPFCGCIEKYILSYGIRLVFLIQIDVFLV